MAITSTTAAILTAASTAFSVVGSISQGAAERKRAKQQAEIYEQQARRNAEIAAQKERDFRKKNRAAAARIRAAAGARGIDIGSGSPLLSAEDFAREAEIQALRIRKGGEVAYTRGMQQADLTRQAGESAFRSGLFKAGGSLLKGGARTAYLLDDTRDEEDDYSGYVGYDPY